MEEGLGHEGGRRGSCLGRMYFRLRGGAMWHHMLEKLSIKYSSCQQLLVDVL